MQAARPRRFVCAVSCVARAPMCEETHTAPERLSDRPWSVERRRSRLAIDIFRAVQIFDPTATHVWQRQVSGTQDHANASLKT